MIEYKVGDILELNKNADIFMFEGLDFPSNPIGVLKEYYRPSTIRAILCVELSCNTIVWASYSDIVKVLPNGKLTDCLYL